MNMESNVAENLKEKIKEILLSEGIELIDFKFHSHGGKYSLRCLIDYEKGGVSIDKCAEINKKICNYIEEENSLGDDFVVEVDSPGMDRPLRNRKDFLRMQDNIIGIWLNSPIEEKEYIEGEITSIDDDCILLKMKEKVYRIEFNKIKIGKVRLDLSLNRK